VSRWVHIRLWGGGASWTGRDNVPSFWPTVCQAVGQHTSVAAATLTNKRRQQIIFTEPTLGLAGTTLLIGTLRSVSHTVAN